MIALLKTGVKVAKSLKVSPISKENVETLSESNNGEERAESLMNFTGSSGESSFQEEDNENWVNPWKLQHEAVQIVHFDSPSSFYVVHPSQKLVFGKFDRIKINCNTLALDVIQLGTKNYMKRSMHMSIRTLKHQKTIQ